MLVSDDRHIHQYKQKRTITSHF